MLLRIHLSARDLLLSYLFRKAFRQSTFHVQNRTLVTVTPVRVTVAYNDNFFGPEKDLLVLKIIGYCDSRLH